jgi:hypothetical protein
MGIDSILRYQFFQSFGLPGLTGVGEVPKASPCLAWRQKAMKLLG